eukprot:gene5242-10491_t
MKFLGLNHCLAVVVSTYCRNLYVQVLEPIFAMIFLIDFMMRVLDAPSKMAYIFSFSGVADILAIVPVLQVFSTIFYYSRSVSLIHFIGFLRFLRLLKFYNVIMLRRLSPSSNAVRYEQTVGFKISSLIASIIVFIAFAAGMVFELNALQDDSAFSWPADTTFLWHDLTTAARMLMVIIIVVGFAIFPAQVGSLVQKIISRSKYAGSLIKSHNTRHICLCGIFDYSTLHRILCEIFHSSYSQEEFNTTRYITVAILSPIPPNERIFLFIHEPKYKKNVKYFVGSCKNPYDLKRVRMEEAAAVYVVGDLSTSSLRMEEDSIFLSMISISKYLDHRCKPGFRPLTLVKLTHSARCRDVLLHAGVNIALPLQEFKYTLIGYGAAYPGFLALFLNLNRARSYSEDETDTAATTTEYVEGTKQNLHEMSTAVGHCHSAIRHLSFKDAIILLHRQSRGRLILLAGLHNNCDILIYPKDMLIKDLSAIFVICESWMEARSNLMMTRTRTTATTMTNIHNDNYYAALDQPLPHSRAKKTLKTPFHEGMGTGISATEASVTETDVHLQWRQQQVQVLFRSESCMCPVTSLTSLRSASIHREMGTGGRGGVEEAKNVDSSSKDKEKDIDIETGNIEMVFPRSKSDISTKIPLSLRRLNTFSAFPRRPSAGGGGRHLPIGGFIMSGIQTEADAKEVGLGRLGGTASGGTGSLQGHTVVILTSSMVQPVDVRTLMLPVIFFLRVVRALSHDKVIILSDRCPDLLELATEMELVHPGMFYNVHFYTGNARNLEHLRTCSVATAKVVVLMCAPVASETSEESQEIYRAAVIQADRLTIIASLNLQMILDEASSMRSALSDSFEMPVFTVSEIIHESNVVFLRQKDEVAESRDPRRTLLDLDRDDFYDWPLLSAGSLLVHTAIDSLMAQALYYPNIIAFWDTVLNSKLHGIFESSTEAANFMENEEKHASQPVAESSVKTVIKSTVMDAKPTVAMDGSHAASSSVRPSSDDFMATTGAAAAVHSLDKVSIPSYLVGVKFSILFEIFVLEYSCIPVALYRWPPRDRSGRRETSSDREFSSSSILPYVEISPSLNTIICENDEVFIFRK